VTDALANPSQFGPGVIRNPKIVLTLLTALNLFNYLDRFVMAAVLPKVQDDLQLSNFIGGSLATIFLIGYFATSPIFGALGDRARVGGRKRLLMIGVSVWSVATVASGLARGTASLVAARAAVGVGEASYTTIAPTLIDDIAKPEERGRWMATFSVATPLGSALGYVVGGAVEHAHGWRAAFFVAGGPGLALALLCLLIAEPMLRQGAPSPSRSVLLGSVRTLLRRSSYRNTVLGLCAYTFAIGGFAFWAPKYLSVRYGTEPGPASVTFGLVTVAGGLVGTLAGGWLADRWVRGRASRSAGGPIDPQSEDALATRANLSVCALGVGLGAPLAAAAVAAPSAHAFFAWLLPCEVALFLGSGPVNVAILRSVPPELRATAMALCIFAIHLFGDLWSPPLIGLVADHAPMAWAMMAGPLFYALAAIAWQRGAAHTPARLT
jgi:MFS transporter, Spinster family, sphingosine-1-phosphate transporter